MIIIYMTMMSMTMIFRYGDHKCDHDRTHRVCAQLVEDVNTCQEVRVVMIIMLMMMMMMMMCR